MRKLAVAAGALGLVVVPLAAAGPASATTSSWIRTTATIGNCTVEQVILEGYGNSSHEYQTAQLAVDNPGCWVQMTQYINGNQGASTGWWTPYTPNPYYDGPGYQDKVCVHSDYYNVGQQACTSLY
ncbi:hypothetical protein [Peterkaempfera griseoplana]|uniref:hypothetical protein n=1 Tax=Peterkaempfera griseoplana TaxID=66896 RepID=UPI0006E42A6A|nr:hypothetical protein [Peterkaempfera griseoplana]